MKNKKQGHQKSNRFNEGKIGSGYMATISGQPNLDEFAREIKPGEDTANKVKPIAEKTPSPLEH